MPPRRSSPSRHQPGRLRDAVRLGLQSAIETLYGLERRRSDFRVEDVARLLDALGRPQDRFASVHVAGTNGKGSVCALVERVLRAAHVRTGLFTSPHLVEFRERIRVGGRWIEDAELEERLTAIQALDAAKGRTFFEITTALGFDAFARHGVEWGVVEVGLGGRLDATNVLAPAVTAITSVGLDHTEILGRTLDLVAREKAGIAKRGIPLVAGTLEASAESSARAIADGAGAPWIAAADCVRLLEARTHAGGTACVVEAAPWGRLELSLPLRGRHQIGNLVVALALLSMLTDLGAELGVDAVRDGIAATRWPGRLEPCPEEPRLWWDGAHNPEGIERLANAWTHDLRLSPPGAVVFAASRDKDAVAMLGSLRRLAPDARLFVTRTRNERAQSGAELAARARSLGWEPLERDGTGAAVREALGAVSGEVLLAGSLFAVGEAMREMGGAPGETV